MKLGLDVGSTTIKYVVLDDNERVFDSWSSDILATYRFLYTLYIRTFFIMSIFLFFLLLIVVKRC